MVTPKYSNHLALGATRHRIQNPPDGKHLEHYVGSWAFTMLKQVFNAPFWIITPERKDPESKRKPDLVVERVVHTAQGYQFATHLLMELKANKPTVRFEEALAQVVDEIQEAMENQIEVFVVVQCGMKIGFFEYHNDQSNLDEEGIPHFRGCIYLTQIYNIGNAPAQVVPNLPQGLGRLRSDSSSQLTNPKRIAIRDEAARYQFPCLYDLAKHENEINFLFDYMLNNAPRSSI